MKKNTIKITSSVWKEGKYYIAQCLNVDVSSFGRTKKEALERLEEAVELYLEDREKKLPQIEFPSIETREFQYA